jgi:hypothetical protein
MVPGDVVEDVALVHAHGVGDLGARRFGAGGVEGSDDPFGDLHLPDRTRLANSPVEHSQAPA